MISVTDVSTEAAIKSILIHSINMTFYCVISLIIFTRLLLSDVVSPFSPFFCLSAWSAWYGGVWLWAWLWPWLCPSPLWSSRPLPISIPGWLMLKSSLVVNIFCHDRVSIGMLSNLWNVIWCIDIVICKNQISNKYFHKKWHSPDQSFPAAAQHSSEMKQRQFWEIFYSALQ